MGTSLSKMRSSFEKEKSLGCRGVYLRLDMEMSKIKKLEQEIKDLKDIVLTLQALVTNLQLQRGIVVTLPPTTVPGVAPTIPSIPTPQWPPYTPYIGDPPSWSGSTTTCSSVKSSDLNVQGSVKASRCIQ